MELKTLINLISVSEWYKHFSFHFNNSFPIISYLSALAIIAIFPFRLLVLLKIKGSTDPIFYFFLGDLLEIFFALYFYKELVIKTSFKDVNLLNSKSSLLVLGTLLLNRNKLYSIFAFKFLTFLKDNSKGTGVTSSGANSSSLILMVKAGTKSL